MLSVPLLQATFLSHMMQLGAATEQSMCHSSKSFCMAALLTTNIAKVTKKPDCNLSGTGLFKDM